MVETKRVALLIDTATTWGSGLIEGIAEFGHESVNWQFFLGPHGKYDRMLLPDHLRVDGVIARITSPDLANQLLARRVPTVDVSWYRFGGDAIAHCTCDEVSVAELAAEYFINRGFRKFAYCGSSLRPNYDDRLGDAFQFALKQRHFGCHRFTPSCHNQSIAPSPTELDALNSWLQGLPKPLGLLAFDSLQARQITEACQVGGIEVPHQVAVLGGEHDLLSCTISKPQLSSIDHSPHHVGQAAAQMLAQLMAGDTPPLNPLLLSASRVITRQSTDTVAITDDMLAASVLFIRKHCHEEIQVTDILKKIPISRRALEKGFRRFLGRSPAEELRRVRIDCAVQLLCDTDWPMPRIASACGFKRPELLTRSFRREMHTTPSAFRKQHYRDHISSSPLEPQVCSVFHSH